MSEFKVKQDGKSPVLVAIILLALGYYLPLYMFAEEEPEVPEQVQVAQQVKPKHFTKFGYEKKKRKSGAWLDDAIYYLKYYTLAGIVISSVGEAVDQSKVKNSFHKLGRHTGVNRKLRDEEILRERQRRSASSN